MICSESIPRAMPMHTNSNSQLFQTLEEYASFRICPTTRFYSRVTVRLSHWLVPTLRFGTFATIFFMCFERTHCSDLAIRIHEGKCKLFGVNSEMPLLLLLSYFVFGVSACIHNIGLSFVSLRRPRFGFDVDVAVFWVRILASKVDVVGGKDRERRLEKV